MRFELPIPPSVNSLYRNVPGKGRVKTERYKAWWKDAGDNVWEQSARQRKPEPPYRLDVWLYFKDNRKRDADNYNKAVQDLLAVVLVFEDELVVDACQHKRLDRENPRCVVYLGRSEEE